MFKRMYFGVKTSYGLAKGLKPSLPLPAGCTIAYDLKKVQCALKIQKQVVFKKSFRVLFQVIITDEVRVPITSSVARGGGGREGLEPPHWLVKYAKLHVFCAFEADFLRKIENSPPIRKQPPSND